MSPSTAGHWACQWRCQKLKWIGEPFWIALIQRLLNVTLKEWQVSHPQLATWAEINLPETNPCGHTAYESR